MINKIFLLCAIAILPMGVILGQNITTNDETNLHQIISVNITNVTADGQDEYITIYNAGNRQPRLQGWTILIDNSTRFTLPEFSIVPLTSTKVHFGTGVSDRTNLYLNQSSAVLNDQAGNVKLLYINDGVVSEVNYSRNSTYPK